MAVVEAVGGSQTAVLTTEHILGTNTSPGMFQLQVDVRNLTADEVLTLRLKMKARSGEASRVVWKRVLTGVQGVDNEIVVSPEIYAVTEISATLRQDNGTGRAFVWSLKRLDAPSEASIADAIWDEGIGGHNISGTFGQATWPIRAGTAQAGAATTITLDASASAVDDFYNNALIVITGGTGAGQARSITDYVGATKVATVATWATTPDSTSVFVIVPAAAGGGGGGGPTAVEIRQEIDTNSTQLAAILADTAVIGAPAGASISADIAAIENQTDDIGTAGAGLNSIPWNAAWDAEVQSEVDDALVARGLDHLVNASVTGTDIADNSIIARLVSKSATADWDSYVNTTDSLEAIRDKEADIETDTQDIQTRLGTPSNLGSGATVAANLADIEGQTDDIGSAGAGLNSIPWNAAWDAQVESEVEDALIAHRLDELLNADSDIDGVAPPTVGSVIHELMTKTAGSFTYDQATDSLEALRDQGDAAWTTGGGLDAAGVRAAVGLASANLDTQLGDLPTNAELATALGTADDATLAAIAALNNLSTAQVNAEVDSALADIRLDELLAADSDIDGVAPPTVGSVFHELMTKTAGSFTYDQATDSLEAVRDRGDVAWITATGFSTLDAAGVRGAVGLASANLDTQLGDLPTNAELATSQAAADDATLAAIAALNDLDATEVQAAAAAALTAYDPPTNTEMEARTLAAASYATAAALTTVDNEIAAIDTVVDAIKVTTDKLDNTLEDDIGTFRFTTNALEQAPTGGSAPTVQQIVDGVWDESMAAHLGAGSTGASLNGAGSAGDPWTTALPGAYGVGTAGKIVGDNLNATVSSRASQTSVDDLPTNAELATSQAAADDATLAAIAALNNLSQANVRTALGMASANLDTQLADVPTNAELTAALGTADDATLAAIAALNDLDATEVQAAAAAALTAYDAVVPADLSTLATSVQAAAIKAKTDLLTFTGTDVNVTLDGETVSLADGSLTSAKFDAAFYKKVADELLRRSLATALASADGDVKSFRSLAGAVAKLTDRVAIADSTLTVYETDDTTALGTQTLTTSAAAVPIIEANTN